MWRDKYGTKKEGDEVETATKGEGEAYRGQLQTFKTFMILL